MSENIALVNNDSFAVEVLQATLPVLVDFSATWCGPCRMLLPALEAAAQEYANKIKFVKVDIDESGEIASTYNVRGVPTLILFKSGKVAAVKVGAMTKPQLIDFLNNHL